MTKLNVNIGLSVNDKTGDTLRSAFDKINQNFTELYTLTGGSSAALTELAQDYAAPMFNHASHVNITATYDDANNKILLTGVVAAQVQTDWNAVSGLGVVLNKPSLFSGSYTDLTNKPTIPSAYTLPTASASVLGGIKIGTGLSIDVNGVVTASSGSVSSLVNGAKTVSLGTDSILTLPAPLAQLINASQLATDTAKIYRATNSTDLAAIATAWETWYSSELMFRDVVYQDSIASPNRPWTNKPSWEAYPIIIAYQPTFVQLPVPGFLVPAAKEAQDNYLAYKQLVSSIDIVNGNKTISFNNAGLLSLPGKLEFKDTANAKIILKTIDPFGYVVEDPTQDKTWTFNANGSLTFPNNTTQTTAWTGSVSSLVNGVHTLSLGSNGNTTFPTGLVLGAPRGVGTVSFTSAIDKEFQIETGTSTTSKLWRFGTDGKLTAPGNLQVDGGKIILNTGGNAYVESVDYGVNSANSALNIFGGPYQKINLRAGFGTQATWTFATDGTTTFPSNSIKNSLGSSTAITTQRTLTANNTYTNVTDFSTDVDLGGIFGVIAGWYQRNASQIEFALFGPSAFISYLTGLALGRTVIVTYNTSGGTATLTGTLTQVFASTGQTDPNNPSRGRVGGRIDATLPVGQLGIASINFPVYSTSTNDWTFGANGNTTFPTGLTLGAPRGSGTVSFTSAIDKEFQIETGTSTTSKLWRFGTTGALTFPNGTLKITDSVISNLNVVGSLSTGSQIQVGNGTAAGTGIIISNGTGDDSTSLRSLINLNGNNASMMMQVANSLGGEATLTGQQLVEVGSGSVVIGLRVINAGAGAPVTTFSGWTFNGQSRSLTLPEGAVINETASSLGLSRTKYSGTFVLDPTWFVTNAGNLIETTTINGTIQLADAVTGAFSFQYFGYFVPPTSANYTFRAHADETFVFWIGAKALSGYTYANKDMYGDYNGTFPEQQTQSFTIALTAGEFYPIRIQWANSGGVGELDVFTWANDVGQANTANFTGRIYTANTGTAKIAVNDNKSIILSTNTTNNNWTFAPNGALTLPNSAVIRQSTNTEVTSAFVAYTAAIASWEYTRINDYLYSINNNPNLSLAGWAFAGWNDVSGTTASAYLAILSNAMIIQNSAPSSPPTPLVFTPALSASLAVQIGTGLQQVISTYAAWQALLTSVDIVAGKERLSLLSNNKIQIPGIIQTDVEEDIIIRTRFAGVTSPAGSGALSYANKDFIFGTNGTLTFEKYAGATSGNAVIQGDSSGNLNLTGGNYVNIESNPYAAITLAKYVANTSVDLGNSTSPVRAFGNLQIMSGRTLTFADSTVQSTAYVKTTGTWTVTTGTNNYSFTVPASGAYQLWVRGNIPDGIISYIATVHVTNPNVQVLGSQRAWNYTGASSPILLTSMPSQIIGTEGTISTGAISGTTNNVFVFGISNTSGSNQTVSWGYVSL